jgi:hypothetical protein
MKFLFDHNLSHRLVGRSQVSIRIRPMSGTLTCTPKMMNRYGTMQPCMALSSSLKMLTSIKEVLYAVRHRR